MDDYGFKLHYQGQFTKEDCSNPELIDKWFSCITFTDAAGTYEDYTVLTDRQFTLEEILKKIELYYGVPLNYFNSTYPLELHKRIKDFYDKFNFGRNEADFRVYCSKCGELMIRTGDMDDDYVYECPHCKETSFVNECCFDE